ncbi:MAG TPA: hypothetical protein VN033_01215 [Vulgatibacter sp.]|nr:hypothetical protein [Vulgatibacter sp.]
MDPVARVLDVARRKTPLGRSLRSLLIGASQWSVPPGIVHRLLAAERRMRRQVSDEAWRALYYQPIFAALCEKVDGPFRLEICPDSRVPVVVNCRIRLGKGVRLSARTTFSGARNAPDRPAIEIGDDTYLGHRVVLRAGTRLRIGDRCHVASNVFISGDPGHPLDPERRRTEAAPAEDLKRIDIGDDVWIAEGAAIVGEVAIGEGAIVAARSVVHKDVPPHSIVAGVPAKVVKRIESDVKLRSVPAP